MTLRWRHLWRPSGPSSAALEWQPESLESYSRLLLVACPLDVLDRRASLPPVDLRPSPYIFISSLLKYTEMNIFREGRKAKAVLNPKMRIRLQRDAS
jgi:hypothetical protein